VRNAADYSQLEYLLDDVAVLGRLELQRPLYVVVVTRSTTGRRRRRHCGHPSHHEDDADSDVVEGRVAPRLSDHYPPLVVVRSRVNVGDDVHVLVAADVGTVDDVVEWMRIRDLYSKTPRKGKGFPYSLPSVGPGTDPGVQTVRPQVTILSHPPGGRLPLLSVRPAVTFPATEYHRPLAGTKLYCLVTEAHS